MSFRLGLHITCALVILTSFLSCGKEKIVAPPIILGHGGTSLSGERAVFPPNSEESILYGLDALNANGAEIDLQLTRDSVLVLFHDERTEEGDCISDLTLAEIQTIDQDEKYPILTLEYAANLVLSRGKYLFLDAKHYNHCQEEYIDFTAFNWALNEVLSDISELDKKRITINSRNIDLLLGIEDTVIRKSFETEKIDLGISYAEIHNIDMITTKLGNFTTEKANQLKTANLDYCLFGIKTRSEIREAGDYSPVYVVTDNIAATRKYYYH